MWKRLIYQGFDYGDYYEVSDSGELRNAKTKRKLKLNPVWNGYLGCVVSLGGRRNKKCIRIHKAVAESFIPNPELKSEVNHIDGNKSNNAMSNLEWVTSSENTLHAIQTGLQKRLYGEQIGTAKLSRSDIEWMLNIYKPRDKDFGMRALARKFNVDHRTVFNVLHGVSWKDDVV